MILSLVQSLEKHSVIDKIRFTVIISMRLSVCHLVRLKRCHSKPLKKIVYWYKIN